MKHLLKSHTTRKIKGRYEKTTGSVDCIAWPYVWQCSCHYPKFIKKVEAQSEANTMNQHMAFQFAGPIACVVALVATVGLLSFIQRLLGMFCKIVCLHFHIFFSQESFMLCYVKLKDN